MFRGKRSDQPTSGEGVLTRVVKSFSTSFAGKSTPGSARGEPDSDTVQHAAGNAAVSPARLASRDGIRKDLDAFLGALSAAPSFANIATAQVGSLMSDELARILGGGFYDGPQSLPQGPLTESTVLDLVAAFCRQKLPHRQLLIELLERQTALLEQMANVVEFTVPPGARITVVGDLHGQFQDLMHIFRRHGFPCPQRPYLFNGDFVDRGDCGVEITLTIFAFQQLYPGSVLLNRGNHEEKSVHSIYGFLKECTQKYDKEVYEAFNTAFSWLPIGCIINGAVLVMHGGIDSEVTLDKLRTAPRAQYVVNNSNYGPGTKPGLVHPAMRHKMEALRKQQALMHPINSALWNDPTNREGEGFNKGRGTGMLFGYDVCEEWLQREGLQLLIRSHEQAENGFEWPFGDNYLCATVFSASNYCCRNTNRGAVIQLGAPGSAPPDGVPIAPPFTREPAESSYESVLGDDGGEESTRESVGSDGRSSDGRRSPPTRRPSDGGEGLPVAESAPPPRPGLGGGFGFGGRSMSNMGDLLAKMDKGQEEGGKEEGGKEEGGKEAGAASEAKVDEEVVQTRGRALTEVSESVSYGESSQ